MVTQLVLVWGCLSVSLSHSHEWIISETWQPPKIRHHSLQKLSAPIQQEQKRKLWPRRGHAFLFCGGNATVTVVVLFGKAPEALALTRNLCISNPVFQSEKRIQDVRRCWSRVRRAALTAWNQKKQNECNLSPYWTSSLYFYSAAGVIKKKQELSDETVTRCQGFVQFLKLTNPALRLLLWRGLLLNCNTSELWQTVLTLCFIWCSPRLHLSTRSSQWRCN